MNIEQVQVPSFFPDTAEVRNDIAPTFLTAAGIEVPDQMTGRSLLPILEGKKEERDFVVFGRERHVEAQKNPSTEGYPSRGIRTDE